MSPASCFTPARQKTSSRKPALKRKLLIQSQSDYSKSAGEQKVNRPNPGTSPSNSLQKDFRIPLQRGHIETKTPKVILTLQDSWWHPAQFKENISGHHLKQISIVFRWRGRPGSRGREELGKKNRVKLNYVMKLPRETFFLLLQCSNSGWQKSRIRSNFDFSAVGKWCIPRTWMWNTRFW